MPKLLDDPENPFRLTVTREFDVNNPDAETKFDLANSIPRANRRKSEVLPMGYRIGKTAIR